jgi:hypothetical protein
MKKYKSTVKTTIPAYDKLYKVKDKKKYRYITPTRYNTRSAVRYFLEDNIFGDDTLHSHGIGSVSFYSREYFGTKNQIKYQPNRRYIPIRYYFKPNVDLGYSPLPTPYRESEAVNLQKENKLRARRIAEKKELQQIYKYLLDNKYTTTVNISPSTDLEKKVYEAVIRVPEYVESEIEQIEQDQLLREYQFAPIYQIEPFDLNIYQWALRVEYCAEYRNGNKGYKKEDLPTSYPEWREHYWNVQAVLGLVENLV